jgi:hypothetical protein
MNLEYTLKKGKSLPSFIFDNMNNKLNKFNLFLLLLMLLIYISIFILSKVNNDQIKKLDTNFYSVKDKKRIQSAEKTSLGIFILSIIVLCVFIIIQPSTNYRTILLPGF